jgi:hypothetical protein
MVNHLAGSDGPTSTVPCRLLQLHHRILPVAGIRCLRPHLSSTKQTPIISLPVQSRIPGPHQAIKNTTYR